MTTTTTVYYDDAGLALLRKRVVGWLGGRSLFGWIAATYRMGGVGLDCEGSLMRSMFVAYKVF